MDFGQNDSLALEELSKEMYDALEQQLAGIHHQLKIDIGIQEKPLLQKVNDRYTLKANIPIKGLDGASGIAVIGFAPGDGTGSGKDFPNMACPENHRPRYKKSKSEFFIPVGTLYNDYFVPGVTSLDEITLNKNLSSDFLISHATHPHSYMMSLSYLRDFKSATLFFPTKLVALTYFTDDKETFGNPHCLIFEESVSNSVDSHYKNWIQLGAFIEFNKPSAEMELMKLYAKANISTNIEFTSDGQDLK